MSFYLLAGHNVNHLLHFFLVRCGPVQKFDGREDSHDLPSLSGQVVLKRQIHR